jgi:ABC-type branched-subunit amino acid transport system permease subunit
VAILATKTGAGFFPAMLGAMAVTAIAGVALAYPTVRVRGVYLAVVTIAFGLIVQNVAIDWRALTGGTLGISNVPRINLGAGPLNTRDLYWLIAAVTFAGFVVHHNLMHSRVGRAMRAVAQSETAARALGIDPIRQRVLAFVLSSVFAGIAGGLYAYLNRYVNPDTFSFSDSIRCSHLDSQSAAGVRQVATVRLRCAPRAGDLLPAQGHRQVGTGSVDAVAPRPDSGHPRGGKLASPVGGNRYDSQG